MGSNIHEDVDNTTLHHAKDLKTKLLVRSAFRDQQLLDFLRDLAQIQRTFVV
jgi:hypothetical protein